MQEILDGWHPSPGDVLSGSVHPLQSFAVEGGAAAVPGRDAASQDTLDGAPAEVGEYPGVHAAPPQPPQEEEPQSSHLCMWRVQLRSSESGI